MKKLYTIPSIESIEQIANKVPRAMVPNLIPHACVAEGALSDTVCDAIIDQMTQEAPYKFRGCEATTREITSPLPYALQPIRLFGEEANASFWKFHLGSWPTAWMQLYSPGEGYQLHADSMIGAMRKLTVVALLSDELDYSGGLLRVMPYPEYYTIPKTRGTMVAFPAWMLHDVTKVTEGSRISLNMGFYGDPFR